ncbi:MAG: succinate dehydrogenase assembly factor 2 [Alphaproteobacteria bacterium]|nr:succinate dehydrogenase assembly factor 2 [Alphaproteobacteria bacterium]
MTTRLNRIRFRAWRRGFREADMILGPFSEQVAPQLDETDLALFEALLDEDDHTLYGWIKGSMPTPPEWEGPLMDRIRRFVAESVSSEVARGIG